METDGSATSTFPKDRYLIWITSKRGYIILHPLKDQPLIFQASVAGRIRMFQCQES